MATISPVTIQHTFSTLVDTSKDVALLSIIDQAIKDYKRTSPEKEVYNILLYLTNKYEPKEEGK